MKNLLTLILILFFFSCDVTEPTIHGCIDTQACNYNPEATLDNNSCEYAEEHYDCDGICLSDLDSDEVCDEIDVYCIINKMDYRWV